MTHHATTIAFDDRAVLLRGPSGSGKSDLAVRLLALPSDALRAFGVETLGTIALVADDRVVLERSGAAVVASAPALISGLIEMRGVGVVRVASVRAHTTVSLVVDLVEAGQVERMPEVGNCDLLGVPVPHLRLAAFEASTPIKVALALLKGLPAP